MRYLSLDLETTGIDSEKCQILQLACIVEDTERKLPLEKLPKLNLYFKHDAYTFDSIYPIHMHQELFKTIEEKGEYFYKMESTINGNIRVWYNFIEDYFGKDPVTLAGKNVIGFDLKFLRSHKLTSGIKFRHRAIDPSILYIDWKNDKALPDSQTMFDRAKLDATLAHDALDDAWQVIRCLRNFY